MKEQKAVRRLTARERHVAEVCATEINPEEYLRRERAIKWQPVKSFFEGVGIVCLMAAFAAMGYVFLAVTP